MKNSSYIATSVENTREVELPEEFTDGKILISNYNDAKVSEKITLRPYEAIRNPEIINDFASYESQ